ncbi:MAG: RlpA-like double-psi beta-barrel domain-containing protein [bacterium]
MKHRYYWIMILLSFMAGNFVYAGEIGLYAKLYHSENAIVQTQVEAVISELIDNPRVNINLSAGQTASVFDDKFQIIFKPDSLLMPTKIELEQIIQPMDMPWNLQKLSNIYQFDFVNDQALGDQPFTVQISYDQESNVYKQIFYYDNIQNSWKPLPSMDYPSEKFAQATIQFPFARLAVFSHYGVLTAGKASWYAYKGGDFAASPDFPNGSIIRVVNLDNAKSVDVTINDWGPERDKFPDRAIDLDKVAFAKIASLGVGVINVRLEPLYVAPDSYGRVLGVKTAGMANEPLLTAKSAVIMDAQDGKVLFDKNGSEIMPLASLTKLIAVDVYLKTKPNLFSTVEYKYEDEKITHQYCSPWESAKIKLKDGDKVLAKDLIYAVLVRSANNAVETLVRASGLPRNEFIARMNSYVREWGALSTNFVEPTGLSVDNVSTTKDYAIIIREIFKNSTIAKASIASEYEFTTLNTNEEHKVRNTNKLVATHPEIIGSKTGYLHEAKHCLAVKIKHDKEFLIVIFGADSRDISSNEMLDLITYSSGL